MHLTLKSSFALAAATLLTSASAHSWIEEMSVIAKNGTFVGEPGYPRAFAKRAAGVDPDKAMVHLLPPNGRPTGNKILDSDPMCMPSQQQPKQSDGSPMLKAAAGDMVALRYQENGHVTLPENQPGKPPNRGTVYIYGTTDPKPDDKFLSIHKVWNPQGTGGDKRGKLLATEPFDDGQCYQINGGQISTQRQAGFKHQADPIMGQDLWCQNNFKIPQDAPSGKPYTIYWVWEWDTAPGTAGQPQGLLEKYTTCMDISLQGRGNTQSNVAESGAVQVAKGQDLNFAAIPKYVEQLNAGSDIFVPGSAPEGKGAASASSAATPQSSQPAAAAAPAPAMSQSSAPAAAGQMTVTVTAPAAAEKTVTVTADGQSAGSPSTTKITTHPTVYVTQPSTMQTQVAPTNAASAQASSMPSAATPVTVSGVVIPTMSIGNRFTGTASAVTPAQTAASNPGSGSAGKTKRCESCKPAKRSTILGADAKDSASHIAAHINGRSVANARLRNPGSAKFRAI
ncbi:MAG: hypothetical protein LQ343_002757 [Gyalolechia ehrenbergii]|nr:MAG: hypothetical protein LQ343_002757 [Gyalolechia ehrenbergii]